MEKNLGVLHSPSNNVIDTPNSQLDTQCRFEGDTDSFLEKTPKPTSSLTKFMTFGKSLSLVFILLFLLLFPNFGGHRARTLLERFS